MKILAQVIRAERYGRPSQAFRLEEVELPPIQADEVLVKVVAAGVNYNAIFAARGAPFDVIAHHKRNGATADFQICGSDGAGEVVEVGRDVTYPRKGDSVVLHCAVWDQSCVIAGETGDAVLSPTFRIWGYETNWGSFAQFAIVKSYQCLPKPQHLDWAESSVSTLVGATAYRMLHRWRPHNVRCGDMVLVWGGAGGVGSAAIQIAKAAGALPVAIVSSETSARFCADLGAVGVIDRRQAPPLGISDDQNAAEVSHFYRSEINRIAGHRVAPRIVVEHPGCETIPVSVLLCSPGGLIVTCGATTGYLARIDLRHIWMRQKRIQGSHYADLVDINAFHDLVLRGQFQPHVGRTYPFSELAAAHEVLCSGEAEAGKVAVIVDPRD
jgi:crotonyl-CoA carboxylase/reductase